MSVLEIESELEKMTNKEREIVIEIATKLIHAEKPQKSVVEKRAKLKGSVEIMISEYKGNTDLAALTALDVEDFIDA